MPARERRAAEAAHIILYLLLVACSSPDRPSSRSRRSTSRRCCTVWCPDRTCRWPRSSPDPTAAEGLLKLVHAYGAWLLPALVALHVAAALRHHYLLHDDVLLRMLPWRTAPGRRDLIGTRDEPARPNPPSDSAVRHRPRLRGEWKADPPRSSIWFSGVQVGSPFSGRFERFEATVDFNPAKPEKGHAVVLIDLASARIGDAQRDEALPQKDWFDVGKSPQARYEAMRFVDKGKGDYEAIGPSRSAARPVTRSCRSTSRRSAIRPTPRDTSISSAPASGSARAPGPRASGWRSKSVSTSI